MRFLNRCMWMDMGRKVFNFAKLNYKTTKLQNTRFDMGQTLYCYV